MFRLSPRSLAWLSLLLFALALVFAFAFVLLFPKINIFII